MNEVHGADRLPTYGEKAISSPTKSYTTAAGGGPEGWVLPFGDREPAPK